MPYLTPEAKSKLSSTIRTLRERLLTDLHNAVDSAYQLSIPLHKAGLSEEMRVKRQRLENWLEEQSRSERQGKEKDKQARERYLRTAEKLAAATLLNRLVVIKQMEAHELIKPAVVTGGWQSRGYREFRDFAPELLKDESEGYSILLQLLYDELALDLPGLFGNVGVTVLKDPSLAVAHGCFWKYHPQKAYEWELRLQDEIAPDFKINEIDSDKLREQFELENPELVLELKEKEDKRRERKRKKEESDNDFSLDIKLEESD